MSLEQHVPSLELCKKWKELGGRQDTNFRWTMYSTGDWDISPNEPLTYSGEWYSAPLASEMMEWERNNINYIWPTEDFWNWCDNTEKSDYDPSLPNALMQMCIARKEEENAVETK